MHRDHVDRQGLSAGWSAGRSAGRRATTSRCGATDGFEKARIIHRHSTTRDNRDRLRSTRAMCREYRLSALVSRAACAATRRRDARSLDTAVRHAPLRFELVCRARGLSIRPRGCTVPYAYIAYRGAIRAARHSTHGQSPARAPRYRCEAAIEIALRSKIEILLPAPQRPQSGHTVTPLSRPAQPHEHTRVPGPIKRKGSLRG